MKKVFGALAAAAMTVTATALKEADSASVRI